MIRFQKARSFRKMNEGDNCLKYYNRDGEGATTATV